MLPALKMEEMSHEPRKSTTAEKGKEMDQQLESTEGNGVLLTS